MLAEKKQFDDLVFIGRFQPFHIAHREVIDIALSISQSVVLVLGSAQDERTIKNPFTVAERQRMILSGFSKQDAKRLKFVPIIDLYNDEKWVNAVTNGVNMVVAKTNKVGLIGHFKDDSSYYLKLFPQWPLVELPNLKNALSATPLREKYYRGEIDQQKFTPEVQLFLQEFQHTQIYQQLRQHFQHQDESVI
ncbi:nicotinate-nicotinamide nucleotide adenylyltransferase [Acinetobacter qingfengensis]|uniref:Nicotinamide-nucleotide adenylyltransferase n=1 Tax=Acinetobacter qingfengensis TaxID=1262585 RepID=A0A1E7RDI4_9GAMM|nr:nicotinate-nicotinamide nucleotide adenylyltransferase [Acinetobacter qingfengensis]KAA8735289.1 nicotinate-nicotinamide nucleotide adenylyltransferase [Acinetobacter qingfengensis]OEY97408.1 nicotinamide-nucleotide adenylyltransferase [Acinetobacter qingfengensis]